jgi:hypothetical protein
MEFIGFPKTLRQFIDARFAIDLELYVLTRITKHMITAISALNLWYKVKEPDPKYSVRLVM